GNHLRVVVWRDEDLAGLSRDLTRMILGVYRIIAVEFRLPTKGLDQSDLIGGGATLHVNGGSQTAFLCGVGDCHAVVSRGSRNNACLQLLRGERENLVHRTPQFERSRVLQVL